jgi:hypothetical protein
MPFIGLLKGSSNPAVTGGPQLPEPSLTVPGSGSKAANAPPSGPPPSPTTFSKAHGISWYYIKQKQELERYLKRRLTKKEESELVVYARESYNKPAKQVKAAPPKKAKKRKRRQVLPSLNKVKPL